MNRVILVGRLSKDPELRITNAGTSVVSMGLAVNSGFNSDGTEKTSFITCNVFGATADAVANFLGKGSMVAISGRLEQRTFVKKDGTKASVIEVNCDEVNFISGKKDDVVTIADEDKKTTKKTAKKSAKKGK